MLSSVLQKCPHLCNFNLFSFVLSNTKQVPIILFVVVCFLFHSFFYSSYFQNMDMVEILLLSIVGFSVLVFLILDWLKSEKSSDFYYSESKTIIGSWALESKKENDHQEKEESVGTKKQTACEIEREEGFVDDWEEIERTELEKIFGEAVAFVSFKSNVDQIGDAKLELYGLEKVALEGPCYESQPMALKVSARSKWNAWHKVGNMSREMAMEKYVDILSKAIPNWKVDDNFISSRVNYLNTPWSLS